MYIYQIFYIIICIRKGGNYMANMDKIKPKLELIPHLPGSYQYYDINGNIIYVGTAKELKNRVS